MTQGKKFNEILNNYINGNYEDFREAIKKLTKVEIVELISYVKSGEHGTYIKLHNILTALEIHLVIK